ncbi:hypothetical protein L1049_020505 [Liquidambar formosana]|uniref:Phloem protein 2 n=1 Tax=Liquidambar formosana TaxID=63359 RepID=A0AAP0SD75_LIQFO
MQKKWVDNNSGHISFMLYARSFYICWGTSPEYWTWNCLKETRDETIEVAKLIKVCWLDVGGNFEISDLSPGIVYEVVYVVKLTDESSGWEFPITLRLSLPDGKAQERQVSLLEKPKEEWIELNVGNFNVENGETGEVYFNLAEHGAK